MCRGSGYAPVLLVAKHRFSLPVTETVVVPDWAGRGYSCDEFRDPPGRAWNDFVHDTNELVTVIEGRLRVALGGQTLELEPGDELFIPKGAVHSVTNIHTGVTRWLYGYD
jgi:mannose-6-phosphate isomerase-like protein (cupin superfamily)